MSGIASVAVAWSPKWLAKLDGMPLPLSRDKEGLISFTLPKGTHILSLDFCMDLWDYIGITVSMLTMIALITVIGWGRIKNCRHLQINSTSKLI